MAKGVAILNAAGQGCVAVEDTPTGQIHYFQNDADVDELIKRMVASRAIALADAAAMKAKYMLSACFRSSAGGCTGTCTATTAICSEHGIPPYTSCYCS